MYHHDPISPIYQTVWGLLRGSLWNEAFSHAEADWDAVWTELTHHSIQILPVDLLIKADPVNHLKYIQAAYHSVTQYYKLMQEQQTICRLLLENGIPCAVLKGASAGRYYPKAANRRMGDIDLIVAPADFERAYQILSRDSKYLGENYRHVELRRNGIIVELHRCFATFHNKEYSKLLDDWIIRAIPRASTVSLDGFSFPSLPAGENGLVLLTHLNIHMERGIGLRQIIDWMMFVDRNLDDDFWNSEFGPAARQLGLETLALTTTKMCQLYLGLRQDITWCRNASDDLCRDLMEYIMSQGNFGRKMPRGFNQTINVLSTAKRIPNLFRALQHRGRINWKALKRFPWLKPFAWIYQLCRYIRLGFQKERPLHFLFSAMKQESRQDTILSRLGVTRMKEGQ